MVASYYETGPSTIETGQIVVIPSLYPNKDRFVLDITADPSEENLIAAVKPLEQTGIHIPIRSLGLRSDEYYFAVKGKLRPAIVLAGGFTRWPMNPSEKIFICVPLYGVDKPTISQKFVVEVQALRYPSMFYLPPSKQYHIEESVARFTLIQVAHGTAVKPKLAGDKPIMLSTEFFGYLKAQLVRFLGGVLPEKILGDVNGYGEIVLEVAKNSGLKF